MIYTRDINTSIYEEPKFDYIIVKTKIDTIIERGNLYEATRYIWKIGPKVENYRYVFSVIDKIVQEVYMVRSWKYVTDGRYGVKYNNRYEFVGEPAIREIANNFIGKQIPEYYTKKGMASPVLYSKN